MGVWLIVYSWCLYTYVFNPGVLIYYVTRHRWRREKVQRSFFFFFEFEFWFLLLSFFSLEKRHVVLLINKFLWHEHSYNLFNRDEWIVSCMTLITAQNYTFFSDFYSEGFFWYLWETTAPVILHRII